MWGIFLKLYFKIILDFNTKKFINLKLNIDAYPKYYLIGKNKILVKDKDSEYYIVEINISE